MLKSITTTYEIYEAESGVLLVDGLTFDEVAEQSKIYADFFEAEIIVVVREWVNNISHTTIAQQFKSAFVNYFADLQEMGNLA